MKKRFFAVVCFLALCVGGLTLPNTAGAAGEPCFMAVNDSLLELETPFMPIIVGGLYYVPYTVFDNTITAINLGVYLITNTNENTVSLYSKQDFLTFNLSAGNSSDREGKLYDAWAVTRNGYTYLPARFVCEFFGLSYSSQSTPYGPLVRIKNASAKLSDADFVAQADQRMADRLAKWEQAQAPVEEPVPIPTPSPSQGNKSGVDAYLGIRHSGGDGLEDLLDSLEQNGVRGIFFFPAKELATCDEAIRAVLCGGHQVGLLAGGITADEVARSAAEGNRLLAHIARLETNMILAEEASDAVLNELEADGYLCWRDAVDGTPDGRTASRRASAVLNAANAQPQEVWITLDDTTAGTAVAERVVQGLRTARYNIAPVIETAF